MRTYKNADLTEKKISSGRDEVHLKNLSKKLLKFLKYFSQASRALCWRTYSTYLLSIFTVDQYLDFSTTRASIIWYMYLRIIKLNRISHDSTYSLHHLLYIFLLNVYLLRVRMNMHVRERDEYYSLARRNCVIVCNYFYNSLEKVIYQ